MMWFFFLELYSNSTPKACQDCSPQRHPDTNSVEYPGYSESNTDQELPIESGGMYMLL